MIHLITGGQKCGKSEYAEKLILSKCENPVYLATSRVWDERHKQRIEAHQQRRGNQWTNLEEEKNISKYNLQGRYILLDCITLWLNNFFFDNGEDDQKTRQEVFAELDAIFEQDSDWIIVSNELGMGGHPGNQLALRFNDLQGEVNQYIAQKADVVTLVISGIPVEIKNTL